MKTCGETGRIGKGTGTGTGTMIGAGGMKSIVNTEIVEKVMGEGTGILESTDA
jgi:hypothetical protein